MKILFVSAEAAPLVKVGGLADVAGSLPRALKTLGHDVRVLLPQYGCIDTQRFPLSRVQTDLQFSLGGSTRSVNLNRTDVDGVTFYTLENAAMFGTREVYINELERFFFFSRAVFEILPRLDWQPEVIHCHDWHTALVTLWLKKAGYPYSSVFTIHNLAYQGYFDQSFMDKYDLKKDWDTLPPGAPKPPYSCLSQAVLSADLVTTVSETYAREIATPELGAGLETLLRYRQGPLIGIINGIDFDLWNPQTDPYLPVNFDSKHLPRRALNKVALQRVAGLPLNGEIPLIGLVQRLDEQKGLDIVAGGMDSILNETGGQVVILGRGRENYEEMLRQISRRYPRQAAVFIGFEEPLAHLIYGGCDLFLMPSRFEPCGLGQMIAMRYGALPVVRHTGGLVDTVPQFNSDLTSGNGFVFHEYSSAALAGAVKEACQAFKNKTAWQQAMQRISRLDFSWQASAKRYETAYRFLLEKSGKG